MKKNVLAGCLLGAGLVLFCFGATSVQNRGQAAAAEPAGPMLAHNVYFSLKDNSEAAKNKLIAACKKYVRDHPGTVFFAVGVLSEDLNRPVNDRDFDVVLHVVFNGWTIVSREYRP